MVDLPVPVDTNPDRVLDAKEFAAALQADHRVGLNNNGVSHLLLFANLTATGRLMLMRERDPEKAKAVIEGAVAISLRNIKSVLPELNASINDPASPPDQVITDKALKRIAESFDSVKFDAKDIQAIQSHTFISGIFVLPPDSPRQQPQHQDLPPMQRL